MWIVDALTRDYLAGKSLAGYRDAWYFTSSTVAGDAGRNIFTQPDASPEARRQVEEVYRELLEAAAEFVPVNREVWDVLFPDWLDAMAEVQADLIVGFPEPYDAVTACDGEGTYHIIFDLLCWTKYLGRGSIKGVARNLLTHELCHVLLHQAVPGLEAAAGGEDYRSALDALTFDEGFAHLVSYRGAEIADVDWNGPELRDVGRKSAQTMEQALAAVDPEERQSFLYRAQCGDYYDKYACMAGMLYLAEKWREGGVSALKARLEAGYRGFAAETAQIHN